MAAFASGPVGNPIHLKLGERGFPWFVSTLGHCAIAIVIIFAAWSIAQRASPAEAEPSIISPITDTTTLTEPALTSASAGDREPLQQRFLKTFEHPPRSTQAEPPSPSKSSIDAIVLGVGHNISGITSGSDALAPFGAPHSGSGFMGIGTGTGNGTAPATRIVYILDHSGSMLDSFDFLNREVHQSVGGLRPFQWFNIIVFSEDAQVLGPPQLLRATAVNRTQILDKFDLIHAQGDNDGKLDPFVHAFEAAFAMKPQVVFFLTDGAFDPKLLETVSRLNPERRVRINSVAFSAERGAYLDQLQQLAHDNNGAFRFVNPNDAPAH